MKIIKKLLVAILTLVCYTVTAQVAINTDGSPADNSAMLDVKSTNKGVLFPRLNSAQIADITSPANGLTVFNTTNECLYVFIQSENTWKQVAYAEDRITPNEPPCGGINSISYHGVDYGVIGIGNQCWMTENLRTTKYNDGSSVYFTDNNTVWASMTKGAYCWWVNNQIWEERYGLLYNWYAASNVKNICPVGWHVPSDEEFTILSDYLGGDGVAGSKLKSTRVEPDAHPRWHSPNDDATNVSGFTGLPGGQRYENGNFSLSGDVFGLYWTTNGLAGTHAWYRYLSHTGLNLGRNDASINRGMSIRCIKD